MSKANLAFCADTIRRFITIDDSVLHVAVFYHCGR